MFSQVKLRAGIWHNRNCIKFCYYDNSRGFVLAGIGEATFGALALGLGLPLAATGKVLDYCQNDISKG